MLYWSKDYDKWVWAQSLHQLCTRGWGRNSHHKIKGMVKTAQEDEGNLIKWDSTLKKHQEAHHAHSYAKIPLYPYLYLSFLPQSTGVLSHFSVCSKRLEIFSLVLDGRTCSLNIPPAVKLLLFGNYKTCLKRINLFLWLLRLLWSLPGDRKEHALL